MMTPSSEMTTSSTPSPETLGLATGSLDSNSKTSSALLTPEQALAGKFSGPLKREYVMRKCVMPPQSELEPIETFVWNAIQSKHVDAPDPVHEQGYRAIMDALKRPVDPPMLRMVLIALRTAGNGTVQNQLTTNAVQHAQLIHWIFRFNSAFSPNLAEDNENEQLFSVFKDGSLLDAHLHLVLAMVSARTVNLVPALTAVWRMLSEDSELSEDL
jgi:RNA polymerase I-specific transcription initiation factor RRN3